MIEKEFIDMGFKEDIVNISWKLYFPVSGISFLVVLHGTEVFYEYYSKKIGPGECKNKDMFLESISRVKTHERALKLESIGI
jgi:hypothetical protein